MPHSGSPRTPPTPSRRRGDRSVSHVTLARGTAIGAGSALVVLALWAGAATWYVGARDDLAQRVFVREAEMQYGYEDRIKALQTQLERAVTQNLVEQTAFSTRVETLAARQAEIEARQTWLKSVTERVHGGAGRPLAAAPADVTVPAGAPVGVSAYMAPTKPAPLPEPFSMRLRDAPAESETPPPSRPRDRLSTLEYRLDSLASDELAVAGGLRQAMQNRLSRLRNALGATGLDLDRLAPSAMGGPLVPLPRPAGGGFGPLTVDLGATLADYERLRHAIRAVPLGRPLAGVFDQTSGFGVRLDPFTRGPALHTGIDLRAEMGSPVRATAPGRVTIAEYSGGYGNLIEIDHGNGLATRYGHLSAFSVTPGERVDAGAIVGRAGSTGRSTGSHLHYETRINGEPVDPTRFLAAGAQFAGLLDEAR